MMKNIFRNIFRCFKPVKDRGTIGAIQRILVCCNLAFLFFFALSVVLESVKTPEDKWTGFFETFFIGSACSIVIVIITTIIQFLSKRDDKAKLFIRRISNISTLMHMLDGKTVKLSQDTMQPFAKELKKTAKDHICDDHMLYWFSGEKDDAYKKLYDKLYTVCLHLIHDPAYAYILNEEEVNEIIVKSYEFIKLVDPEGWNSLEGIAEQIREDTKNNTEQ